MATRPPQQLDPYAAAPQGPAVGPAGGTFQPQHPDMVVNQGDPAAQGMPVPVSTKPYQVAEKGAVPPLKPKYKRKAKDAPASEQEPEKDSDEWMVRRIRMEMTVAQRISDAITARANSGIEEIWRESDELYEGVDSLTGTGRFLKVASNAVVTPTSGGDGQSRLILNITKPKTDIAVSRVQEMLVPNDDKAFGVETTPIPELVDDEQSKEMVTLGDGTQAPAALVAAKMKDDAGKAAIEEERWIDDQFVEGDGIGGTVYGEMRKIIKDAGRIGSGVLKGPFAISDEQRKWTVTGKAGNKSVTLERVKRIRPTSKKIRAEDLFPAPDCGDNIHKGSYIVERDYLTGRQLRDLAALEIDGYDRESIGKALVEGPTTNARMRAATYQRKDGENSYESDLFEVFYYFGDCDPDDLTAMNMVGDDLSPEERALSAVPAIVTMLNGRAIKCVVNPSEKGAFPYDIMVWDPVEGQPWGRGVPWKGRTAQKMLIASVRKMMENGGLSAGPQIAITEGALEPQNNKYEIVGRKLWVFKPTEYQDDINKAMAVFNIPSMQEELMNIVKFSLEMFDQLLNLPLLMQGIQQPNTSPETLGGMKMYQQNSTSPLRTTAKQFDDLIIVPHLNRYHDWCMVNGPSNCKGDNRIKARGSSVLVKLEEAREFLMMLYQVKDDPAFRINPQKLVLAMSKANGFGLEAIQYNDDEWKEQEAKMAQSPPPKDPRVEAAEIRTQAIVQQAQERSKDSEADRIFKGQQSEADRQHGVVIQNMEREIEMMRLSGQENISLESIKAMLAGKSMDNRVKRDEMQMKITTGKSGI